MPGRETAVIPFGSGLRPVQNLSAIISVNVSFNTGLTREDWNNCKFMIFVHFVLAGFGQWVMVLCISCCPLWSFVLLLSCCSSLGALRWHCQDSDVQLYRLLLVLLSHLLCEVRFWQKPTSLRTKRVDQIHNEKSKNVLCFTPSISIILLLPSRYCHPKFQNLIFTVGQHDLVINFLCLNWGLCIHISF